MASPSIPDDAPTLKLALFTAIAQLYRVLVDPQAPDARFGATLARLRQIRDIVTDGSADAGNAYGADDYPALEALRGSASDVARVLAMTGTAALLAELHELADLAHAVASALRGKIRV
jgi:hypothetical protein